MLWTRKNITAVFSEDIPGGSSDEFIWVELRNRKGLMTLMGLYYRHLEFHWELDDQICKEITDSCRNDRVVTVRDFNFPNIDWFYHSTRGLDDVGFVKACSGTFFTINM